MKFLVCLFFLLFAISCSVIPQGSPDTPEPLAVEYDSAIEKSEQVAIEDNVPSFQCVGFPFDMSGSACDLAGWQSFVYSEMVSGPTEAFVTSVSPELSMAENIKNQIRLSQPYQPLAIREVATDKLLEFSFDHMNPFGDFLYVLAHYYRQLNQAERSNLELKVKLKNLQGRYAALEQQLEETKAKIDAIMEIEQDLSTEQDALGAQ